MMYYRCKHVIAKKLKYFLNKKGWGNTNEKVRIMRPCAISHALGCITPKWWKVARQ